MKVLEAIKKISINPKKAAIYGLIFLVVFMFLFYLVNLDTKPVSKKTETSSGSFAGVIDEEAKKKMGATSASFVNFDEWSELYGLSVSETRDKRLEDDPDEDGLPDYLEYVHGTNPAKADTDGDGFSDLQEITNGYDPDAPGEARPAVEIKAEKIGIATPMIWSASDDEESQLKDLESGVSHFYKTAAPGQNGNMIVSGHSSNYIWAKGNYNHIFKDLNSLENGDIIDIKTIQQNGRVLIYHYKVSSKFTASPNDEKIFQESSNPVLTLSTCWPLGTNFRRLVVKADMVK